MTAEWRTKNGSLSSCGFGIRLCILTFEFHTNAIGAMDVQECVSIPFLHSAAWDVDIYMHRRATNII